MDKDILNGIPEDEITDEIVEDAAEEESAEGLSPEINPTPLVEIANNEELLIFGLANDELGYVLPPNDFMLNTDSPYLDRAIDRFGRRHYEETNSMGPETAAIIADNFTKIINNIFYIFLQYF